MPEPAAEDPQLTKQFHAGTDKEAAAALAILEQFDKRAHDDPDMDSKLADRAVADWKNFIALHQTGKLNVNSTGAAANVAKDKMLGKIYDPVEKECGVRG